MKTHHDKMTDARRPFRGWLLVALAATGFLGCSLRAADTVPEPKDHALFVGGDVCVGFRGASREVVAATADTITVVVDGKRVDVPMAEVDSVRVERSLKLSDVIAQIGDFKASPVHFRSNAGAPQWAERWMAMSGVHDLAVMLNDRAMARQATAYTQMQSAQGTPSAGAAAQTWQNASAAAASTSQSMMNSSTAMNSFADKSEPETINALEVSCSVSVPKATRDAFLLLVTGFHEEKNPKVQYQIHLEPLKDIGPKARRVDFVQTGLPDGYILDSKSVHLFYNGREVASNLAEKRVDLTASDALNYLTLCYVTKHAKETLAAAPMQIVVPADFKRQVGQEWLQKPVFLTVAPTGVVQQAAADESGTALDPYLAGVVTKFRFVPALKEGKPVESVVAFNMSEYLH